MTRTLEEWKAFHVTPYTRGEMLYSAISDIAELAEQLRVYREAWESRVAYGNKIGPDEKEWQLCETCDAAVRKMRGEA
jgi:hypothetical protein